MPQSKTVNRQIVLNSRPVGAPTPDNFRAETADVPVPGAGQVLLRTVVRYCCAPSGCRSTRTCAAG